MYIHQGKKINRSNLVSKTSKQKPHGVFFEIAKMSESHKDIRPTNKTEHA